MRSFPKFWLEDGPTGRLLSPLSALFRALVGLRRRLYAKGWLASHRLPVPVVIVGNVFVGGAGKTPLVAWLAAELAQRGWRPGVVCRGYGGSARDWPQRVAADSDPCAVGDEPVWLAQATGLPVAAGPRRVETGELLLGAGCNLLILDDGLQHYALARDVEWVVVDAARGLGNGRCLPAGPLREPAERLREVDAVVFNGEAPEGEAGYRLVPERLVSLGAGGGSVDVDEWRGRSVHAVAGIGHPERFFAALEQAGVSVQRHGFPDHHRYRSQELQFADDRPVVMTAKDAVKCTGLGLANAWYLDTRLQPNAALRALTDELITNLGHHRP